MPLETALAYLRAAGGDRRVPPVVVIFGPHAFLREYVLDSIVRKLVADGCQYRSFQVGASDDYAAALNELRAPDLFAPKRAIACRVLKSRRDKSGDCRRCRRRRSASVGRRRLGGGAGRGDRGCARPGHPRLALRERQRARESPASRRKIGAARELHASVRQSDRAVRRCVREFARTQTVAGFARSDHFAPRRRPCGYRQHARQGHDLCGGR